MEAKDTVITVAEYNQTSKAWHIEKGIPKVYTEVDFLNAHEIAILEMQAKISFKAGRQEGRREVVEWIQANADNWG